MRVLMATPSYYPIKGGAETLIRNYSIRLNHAGIDTDIMTFNMDRKWNPRWQEKTERIDGINVHKIPALNWFPFTHSDRMTQGINLIPGRFRKNLKKYDIIHFHVGDLTFPLFSIIDRKPKVAHFHGPLTFYTRYFLSRLILKNIADLYIAISHKMVGELNALGVQPNKIRYLPNAVDTNIFNPSGNKDEHLLLFVGRITRGKGLHILLESLQHIKTKTNLVIIGPPDWDTEYFKEIINRIDHENRYGLHTIAYLGEQEEASIAKWCQKASIFVLPSFREAFGVAILEALSCKTPVVATNIPGIREAVVHRENGILVSINNPLELASSIQYLLDNEQVRANFGKKGREIVMEHFSYNIVVKKLCEIYKELS
jgi:glycosyltransferase involved in cell wall biosynthesis